MDLSLIPRNELDLIPAMPAGQIYVKTSPYQSLPVASRKFRQTNAQSSSHAFHVYTNGIGSDEALVFRSPSSRLRRGAASLTPRQPKEIMTSSANFSNLEDSIEHAKQAVERSRLQREASEGE